MTAEAIARVVADLRAARVRTPRTLDPATSKVTVGRRWTPDTVVDATAIYHSLVERDEPVRLYEDHPCIAPPWPSAVVAYVNEHGNVIAMLAAVQPDPQRWETAEPIDWDRVRWVLTTLVFAGGRSAAIGPVPTAGPLHLWEFAIYPDGEPADLHWGQLVADYPMENWDMAHMVLLGALNFLNCRNVELVEPHRPRAERRRIERTGERVYTLSVFPIGRTTRAARRGEGAGTPLTSVRGHFANYGAAFDRGRLFGKYEGRYWIPQHARGAADEGEVTHDYKLRP